MKFEVGKDYETRGGERRRIVAIRKSDGFIIALGVDTNGELECESATYYPDGRMYRREDDLSDLISEWVEPYTPAEIWVNEYRGVGQYYGTVYYSLSEAQKCKETSNFIRTVHFREVNK